VTENGNSGQGKAQRTTLDQRLSVLERFDRSGLNYTEFAKQDGMNPYTLRGWLQERKEAYPGYRPQRSKRGPYSPEERKKAVEAFISSGMTQVEFSETWGMSPSTFNAWIQSYEQHGFRGLESYRASKPGDKRKGPKLPQAVRDEIIDLKKKEPSFGFKKIKDWMFRFRGVKVSTGTIGKTVKAEGLPLATKPKRRYRGSEKIRRFERATPMQLWQSDITQFTLARTSTRVYLTVFMDDHSRFIVAWKLHTRQTSDLVIDAYKDGVSRFGKPEEVLTDQGRQYFAWRGKSEFEKLLEKEGIKHVVSRSHHPQTLGKCERFWETVGNEFWLRTRPQDLEEARARFQYFVDHYNFQRPHQGLKGHCPADRFFGVTTEVREAIEKSVVSNALQIALGELPKPPAFLIGQIGEQRISFHGTSGKFVLTHENLNGENYENRSSNRSDSGTNECREVSLSVPEDRSSPRAAQEPAERLGERPTPPVPTDSSEGTLGSSVGRGTWTSADIYCDHNGILDGPSNASGSGSGTRDEANPFLATDTTSGCRNVRGASDTAEDGKREHDGDGARHQETKSEN
jgi:transposase InsO family protein/transposase-like protein